MQAVYTCAECKSDLRCFGCGSHLQVLDWVEDANDFELRCGMCARVHTHELQVFLRKSADQPWKLHFSPVKTLRVSLEEKQRMVDELVLDALWKLDRPRASQVSHKAGIGLQTASESLTRLVSKGLVKRFGYGRAITEFHRTYAPIPQQEKVAS